MGSQWENFLRNLGEWRGSFTGVTASGELLESTPSILSLESEEENRLVRFRLRRFGPAGVGGEPISEIAQDYRTLGRQVVFFETGSFCKGTLQVSPGSEFGAEFGFVDADRRHRLVQLHGADGGFKQSVLIREFRTGSSAMEQPACTLAQLEGCWMGQAATISADWPEPSLAESRFTVRSLAPGSFSVASVIGSDQRERTLTLQSDRLATVEGDAPATLQLLPDAGFLLRPACVSHREAFQVEAGWMPTPDRLIRLIRTYDATGAWLSAIQVLASRA
jgi:hypothetical protein